MRLYELYITRADAVRSSFHVSVLHIHLFGNKGMSRIIYNHFQLFSLLFDINSKLLLK